MIHCLHGNFAAPKIFSTLFFSLITLPNKGIPTLPNKPNKFMCKPQGGLHTMCGWKPLYSHTIKGWRWLKVPTYICILTPLYPLLRLERRKKRKKTNFASKTHIPRNIHSNVTLPLPIRVIRNVTLAWESHSRYSHMWSPYSRYRGRLGLFKIMF